MELILIRHLPTKWNKLGILQGSQDIPILPVSKKDSEKIQENIKMINSFKPDIIVASQLMRTKQTALQYGFKHPVIEPLLNELQFGEYEGVEKKELMKIMEWTTNPRTLVLGERLTDFENRIKQFITQYRKYSCVLVFGHGSWIRGFLSIENVGTIQKMNQVVVENNQFIHASIKKSRHQVELETSVDA
ncbi:MAG TPA: phosphoglycerate mutase family protein [Bacillus bacterium]|nr:phosphoglycerate mutase family protein [Bacillus sp. (in: firmicutes)]